SRSRRPGPGSFASRARRRGRTSPGPPPRRRRPTRSRCTKPGPGSSPTTSRNRARRSLTSRRLRPAVVRNPTSAGGRTSRLGGLHSQPRQISITAGEERVVQREGCGYGVRGEVVQDGPLDVVARVGVSEELVRVTEVYSGARVGGVLAAGVVDELLA